MHIALNAWFWNRPDTGSGQYTRQLVAALRRVAPEVTLTLIAPHGPPLDAVPDGVQTQMIPLRHGAGHAAKVRFEQAGSPRAASDSGADLLHVPYWGSPVVSPLPVVVTIHDLIPMLIPPYRGGILARLYTATVAAAARGAAAVITDSQASRRDILTHLKLPPERVTAISLAAGTLYHPRPGSLADMGIRRKYDLPGEYVLYLGGYDVRKNVGRLLEAFTYVRAGYDIPLVLAGALPAKRTARFFDVENLIQRLDLKDNVQIAGWIDEDDKPALYRMAKCFVFPSRYEGFGLPVLEAMACGTPVVACDTSSIPEIVGDAAFLVEPDDVRHMAGSILATLVQEDLAADLRQKGLARAKVFSWEQTARETLAVWKNVAQLPKE